MLIDLGIAEHTILNYMISSCKVISIESRFACLHLDIIFSEQPKLLFVHTPTHACVLMYDSASKIYDWCIISFHIMIYPHVLNDLAPS